MRSDELVVPIQLVDVEAAPSHVYHFHPGVSACEAPCCLCSQMEFIDISQLSFIHDLGPKGLWVFSSAYKSCRIRTSSDSLFDAPFLQTCIAAVQNMFKSLTQLNPLLFVVCVFQGGDDLQALGRTSDPWHELLRSQQGVLPLVQTVCGYLRLARPGARPCFHLLPSAAPFILPHCFFSSCI